MVAGSTKPIRARLVVVSPVGAVQVTAVDEIVLGVRPVELLLAVVQRQAIGPVDVSLHHQGAVGPIQTSTLDLRHLAPVSPVHEPKGGNRGFRELSIYFFFLNLSLCIVHFPYVGWIKAF